ncbi:MAG: carboxypeptidase regulatory-like domain-containing protein, partial [Bacteroidota bacterium]
MKSSIIALFVLMQVCNLHSQTLKGYVYFRPENTPAEFANVVIISLPDSGLVKGVITYTDGQYTATNIKPGNYFVKATFVGYLESGRAVEMKEGQKEAKVDTLYLAQKTEQIEDVTVTGNYVRAKEMVDRTVYEILPEIEKT